MLKPRQAVSPKLFRPDLTNSNAADWSNDKKYGDDKSKLYEGKNDVRHIWHSYDAIAIKLDVY